MMAMAKFCYYGVHNVGWNRLIFYYVLYHECSTKTAERHSQMKFPIQHTSIFLSIILLISCAPRPLATTEPTPTSLPSTASEAQEVLITFFQLMNSKNYAVGDVLYGGNYETMQSWNPDVDPSDHVTLWSKACEQNGLQCLLARTVTLKELQGDTFVFQVEFSNPDGSLFVLGPCCGANENEMPPVSKFEYQVIRNSNGKFVVMDLPPYVP